MDSTVPLDSHGNPIPDDEVETVTGRVALNDALSFELGETERLTHGVSINAEFS